MKWLEIIRDRKIELAAGLLAVALLVSWIFYKSVRSIPGFTETIEINSEKIILTRHFQFVYDKNYPVNIQQLRLSALNTNVVDVRDSEGKMLNFQTRGEQLLIYLNGPVHKGTHLDFKVKSQVNGQYPYFNIIKNEDGTYSFHYISWESYPGNKTKIIHLPSGCRILDVKAGDIKIKRKANSLVLQDPYSHSRKFDVLVHFALPQGFENALPASPPLIEGNKVTFRVPVALYPVTPAIQGDFTSWHSLPMIKKGEFYEYTTQLGNGTYHYQVRYFSMPQADVSINQRIYNSRHESMSILKIP